MNKIVSFFREYADELFYKVQWPSLPELQSSTVTVLVASLLIALLVALMDFVFKLSMTNLYDLFLK